MNSSVNIRPNYHHGDLRAALVKAGLDLLAVRDADDVSLREVARRAGVTPPAVYRHFPDKRALFGALAAEGLNRLGAAQRRAAEAAGGGKAGFNATGGAYVRFALDNPALFKLMFSIPARHDLLSGDAGDAPDALAFLRENAAAIAAPHSNPAVVALQAWSLAHGLAMLILDGQLPADTAAIDAVFGNWSAG